MEVEYGAVGSSTCRLRSPVIRSCEGHTNTGKFGNEDGLRSGWRLEDDRY